MIDWIKIKSEYINGNISQRDLAKKYDISFNTLKTRASKENWADLKKEQHNKITTKVQQKTAEKIIDKAVQRNSEILNLADMLIEKVKDSIETTSNDDTYKIRQLVQSVKDLKEVVRSEGEKDMDESEKQHSELLEAIKDALKDDNK